MEWLKGCKVKGIVNVTSEIKNFFSEGFEYHKIPIADDPYCKISMYFEDAHEFIEEQRKKGSVLIHCQKGQSRSVTLVYSYLIHHENLSLLEIDNFFQKNAVKTSMNLGFKQQLMLYEKKLRGVQTKDFLDMPPRTRRTPQKYSPERKTANLRKIR
uniref:protein-tyrosine-phosphatase n=1 Tax=Arcella intermedia TaxID=1963864 RepID=A0A6B2LME4_9EUKA